MNTSCIKPLVLQIFLLISYLLSISYLHTSVNTVLLVLAIVEAVLLILATVEAVLLLLETVEIVLLILATVETILLVLATVEAVLLILAQVEAVFLVHSQLRRREKICFFLDIVAIALTPSPPVFLDSDQKLIFCLVSRKQFPVTVSQSLAIMYYALVTSAEKKKT